MTRRMRAAIATGVAVGTIGASPAVAQTGAQTGLDPGVHVDPSSPAGKQYAIPIATARTIAAGGQGQSSSNSNPDVPLFGVGVTPAAGRDARTAPAHTRGASRHAGSRAGRPKAAGGSPSASSTPPVLDSSIRRSAGAVAGSNAWLVLAGGGALVFVLGGAGGLALRRRS
jgi:hypothetical protein